jgi:hypothetical protein
MLEYDWKLSAQEGAYILNLLATRPYQEVNQLIGKIHKATSEQTAKYEKAQQNGDDKGE